MTRSPRQPNRIERLREVRDDPYAYADLSWIQALAVPRGAYAARMHSLDELMERDARREEDGFPRKIRIGRLVKPGRGGQNKIVIVPTTVEDKLLHDPNFAKPPEGGGEAGGSGDGDEGEVIGEQPVRPDPSEGEGDGAGPGQGEGGPHEMESNAYDLGRILVEQFALPNLQDKGKRRSLTRYNYDLTDRNRGYGQLLDKKATLKRLLYTNIALGRIKAGETPDPAELMIGPRDRTYRILSREQDYDSQAVVFFVRDYSGSMYGTPTELVVSQHVLIYSWLLYQYQGQIESRFILHDTAAKEVEDFYTYYNSRVAGGTKVAVAFAQINEIVAKENLAQDYNIYVFYGTDGDDIESDGEACLPEIEKMLRYVSRLGIVVVGRSGGAGPTTAVENYVNGSGLLDTQPRRIRMDVLPGGADEPRLIEGIRKLISE